MKLKRSKLKILIITALIASVVITYSVGALTVTKDPYKILSEASAKATNLTSYYLDSEIVIEMNYLGQSFNQSGNSVIASNGYDHYSRSEVSTDFVEYNFITEQFDTDRGSFICYSGPTLNGTVCIITNASGAVDAVNLPEDFLTLANNSLIKISFEGVRQFNGRSCDMLRINYADSLANFAGLEGFGMQNLLNSTTRLCFDLVTGLPLYYYLESAESGIRFAASQSIKNIYFNVSDSLFNLPAEPITEEEFNLLFNESTA